MPSPQPREPEPAQAGRLEFTAAEIGALAHLYRGEVYRSTVSSTRLDSSDQLGHGHHRDRAVGDLQQCGGLAPADGAGRPAGHGLPAVRGATLPLFRHRLTRPSARLLETDFYGTG